MTAVKHNRAKRKLGKGRGVPLRLARAISRRYDLTQIVMLTTDVQFRARLLYWAKNGDAAAQCAWVCDKIEKELGWTGIKDWDCTIVRNLKDRIKDLERDMAVIYEGDEEPKTVARRALKLPDDV
jgi:hypothetical protein